MSALNTSTATTYSKIAVNDMHTFVFIQPSLGFLSFPASTTPPLAASIEFTFTPASILVLVLAYERIWDVFLSV